MQNINTLRVSVTLPGKMDEFDVPIGITEDQIHEELNTTYGKSGWINYTTKQNES